MDPVSVEEMVRTELKKYADELKADLAAVRAVGVGGEQARADEQLKTVLALALAAAGARPAAIDFLIGEARNVFEVRDGAVVAREGQFSRTKPYERLTVAEWVATEMSTHAFAFVPPAGSA